MLRSVALKSRQGAAASGRRPGVQHGPSRGLAQALDAAASAAARPGRSGRPRRPRRGRGPVSRSATQPRPVALGRGRSRKVPIGGPAADEFQIGEGRWAEPRFGESRLESHLASANPRRAKPIWDTIGGRFKPVAGCAPDRAGLRCSSTPWTSKGCDGDPPAAAGRGGVGSVARGDAQSPTPDATGRPRQTRCVPFCDAAMGPRPCRAVSIQHASRYGSARFNTLGATSSRSIFAGAALDWRPGI